LAKVTPEGVRALVEEVLASNDFVNMRSSKMTQAGAYTRALLSST